MITKIYKFFLSTYHRRMTVYFLLFIVLGFSLLIIILNAFSN